MNTPQNTSTQDLWSKIESEKWTDTLIRRVCYASWLTTFLLLICYAATIVINIWGLSEQYEGFNASLSSLGPEIIEIIGITLAFGATSGLTFTIAVLSTIWMFKRINLSSLHDVRMRLVNLEEMIVSKSE